MKIFSNETAILVYIKVILLLFFFFKVTLFYWLSVLSICQCYESGWPDKERSVPKWHSSSWCHPGPCITGGAVSWGVQVDPGAGDPDWPSAAHASSPGGWEKEDRQVSPPTCHIVEIFNEY